MSSEVNSAKNSTQQWILLITLCVVTFLGAMIFAIQAPFYPAEAEKKGATASEYGFVLGTFGLTQFILGPIFGSFLLKIGVKNAFHGGIATAAVSTMLFGFLDMVNNRVLFIVLSFLLRIVEATGALAMSVATYTFVAKDFPGSVAKTFAIIETVYGFGMSFGPSVGVALFNVGGFTLPFVALGFVHFLAGGVTYLVDPKSDAEGAKLKAEVFKKKELKAEVVKNMKEVDMTPVVSDLEENVSDSGSGSEPGSKGKLGFLTLIKIPAITMYACAIVSAILTSQFVNSILEPNFRQFELSVTMFGIMFQLQGLTQAIFSLVFGVICDRIRRPELITLLGSIFLTVATCAIGPFKFFPIEPDLALTAVSLIGVGIGSSAILVSAFLQGLREAGNHGFPVDESTSGLISGLFLSSISFGAFSGPLMAGVLFHHFDFRVATSALCLLNLLMALTIGLFALTKKRSKVNK